MKLYIFDSDDDYWYPKGFAIADNKEKAWEEFKNHGKAKVVNMTDDKKEYYSITELPIEKTAFSFECDN